MQVLKAALVLVVLTVALVPASCGDDAGTDSGTTTEETTTTTEDETTTGTTTAMGREVFVANCGSCHTLSDAGTTGTVGPNLDEVDVSAEQVAEQVENGGGGMPAFGDQLSPEEIQEVAAYVAASGGP